LILSELARHLGCAVRGDGSVDVARVASLEEAGPGDITFVAQSKYASRLPQSRAAAVIVPPAIETPLPSLISDNPYVSFAHAVAVLHPATPPAPGVHPSAQVDATAALGEGVHVGALAVVGPRVRIGPRTVLHPHVVVYADATVGADCLLHAGAQVRERCRLGDRVLLQNGAVVGADGFGFARDESGRYHKIPQVGIVVVEDDVEIGALAAVDRAALHETRIGRGVKIDNLVQVGHSVTIGENSVLSGQVGIAGSTKIGRGVTLAGQVGVSGHITLGDGMMATARSGIAADVEAGKIVSGYPAIDNRAWRKAVAVFARLPELARRLRELERRLEGDGLNATGRRSSRSGGEP
jgi:UDP-3-O-[3-hydroxymyristoyl] glucosamine N-acyltransferase